MVDFHSISVYAHNPDGFSPFNEHAETVKILGGWFKAFPDCSVCIGNHDERLEKAAWRHGLSSKYFKSFREVFEFPSGWKYEFDFYRFGVRIFHGMGYSGKYAHINACVENGQSVVMGHLHANAGVMWTANETSLNFGLAVGCGIDRHAYAFNYGRDLRRKPILGCGVVTDSGRNAQFVPMEM